LDDVFRELGGLVKRQPLSIHIHDGDGGAWGRRQRGMTLGEGEVMVVGKE
jgi:hypothetical protein